MSTCTLLVLRHGKSAYGLEFATDFERPLARRGRKNARQIGKLIKKLDITPDCIVSSPAKRALETAKRVRKQLGDVKLVTVESIYAAEFEDLEEVINDLPDEYQTVLLIGHNPGVEDLVEDLTGRDDVIMRTCSLAVIRLEGKTWRQAMGSTGKLLKQYNPRELEDG